MSHSLTDLLYGFSVAFQWHNLLWCLFGIVVGNLIGVLPGMGVLSTMSILLPLTYTMHPVAAILMLAGIFYGSQYGGAVSAILLNLPSHPPHAITCLDGYPMTRRGQAGLALGTTMLSSFVAASIGIIIMILASPLLVHVAGSFGAPEMFSIMLLGLLIGATMSRGPLVRGLASTLIGLLVGTVGIDGDSGRLRFTFGTFNLADGVELVAMAMGLFGIADFIMHVNREPPVIPHASLTLRDLIPSRSDLKRAFPAMLRGTGIGTLFGALPGTGPTIATFVAYAFERRLSSTPSLFGTGQIEGVAAPEAASHAKTQVDFIPTMTLGIPGDAMMALILGALLIHGIQPGPQLINEHPDIFWGLIASFWIGNILLLVLNMPLIGIWVWMLRVPHRILFPSAIFFIAIGVYTTQNNLFHIWEVLFFGLLGAIMIFLDFPIAPLLLGFVLGPMLEENLRRTMLLSHGNAAILFTHPISATLIALTALLTGAIIITKWRAANAPPLTPADEDL
ncbi:tripartite tricarboxylate transporter permease [Acetobacter tropicalis]|uniref:tripartite tricarboxylate transporter permease n=1 Tax=Acetobacter tropicalis TaxID=104102 RepID=UPI001C3C41DB|nr:tripartite tricarboxylate transporter permease [Acetobacter tropicalis]